jgi:hypothetical protein
LASLHKIARTVEAAIMLASFAQSLLYMASAIHYLLRASQAPLQVGAQGVMPLGR